MAQGIKVYGVFSLFCMHVFLILPGLYVESSKTGSQSGTVTPFRGHLAMSEEILGCHN